MSAAAARRATAPKAPPAPKPRVSKSLRAATRRNYEALMNSQTFCLLFTPNMLDDVIPVIQMGLAVYLDKPIVVICQKGATLPINIRSMATAIEEVDMNDTASMKTAVLRLRDKGFI